VCAQALCHGYIRAIKADSASKRLCAYFMSYIKLYHKDGSNAELLAESEVARMIQLHLEYKVCVIEPDSA
jgi:hypothetical protein